MAFYQHLGKLFYAIAAVDNCVRDEELNKVIEIVNAQWKTLENFNSDAKALIINTFKWLHIDNEYNAYKCYGSFISYMKANKAFFNTEINRLILKTASKIAASFSNQNKSELIMLGKLSIELKKIKHGE